MTAQLSPQPVFKGWANNGTPLAYGLLYTYAAGTTTPQATYVDSTQTTPNTNPIKLNARGECALWLDPTLSYKFNLTDVLGNQIPGYPVDNIPGLLPIDSINIHYDITPAEIAAGVTPTDYSFPNHLAIGYVMPQRYGGAGDNSTLNDLAHANAMLVAGAMGDGTVVYGGGSADIWKFNAPITIGGTNQGRRVIGIGRPEFSFNAGISNALDLVTISANLNSLYQDQPQFDNIQVNCNSGGRDGVVLTVGNRPLIRNIRVDNSGRDGYVESTTAPNWIEKADVSVLVRFAGRNGFRQEILGAASSNPFINEGNYFLEVRGVSAITAGGCALRITGASGLGGAAKLSDNTYKTIFDAIYNTSAAVPATSPVILDTVTVQNATFNVPAWENTGSGGNPGAGPLIKISSGTWGGLTCIGGNWNSFWGDGTFDAAITAVNRIDFSFPATNTLYGKLSLIGNADSQTVLALTGQTTASTVVDATITRTGAASATLGQNANLQIGNSTSSTFAMMQEFNGNLIIFTFSSGAWAERARILNTGGLNLQAGLGLNGNSAGSQVTGWGTPTGPLVVNNFSGSAATLVQCSNAIAKIITDLKALGLYGA